MGSARVWSMEHQCLRNSIELTSGTFYGKFNCYGDMYVICIDDSKPGDNDCCSPNNLHVTRFCYCAVIARYREMALCRLVWTTHGPSSARIRHRDFEMVVLK